MTDEFTIEPLSAAHDRKAFASGIESLDRYLHQLARQDVRRRFANCFVATRVNSPVVVGYYTLAAEGISASDLPEDVVRRLPRYPVVPAALIGRLAVDWQVRELGLGKALLFDAALRALASDTAAFALVVDAKDEQAVRFYRHHQFRPFPDQPRRMFLPLLRFVELLRDTNRSQAAT